MTSLEVEVKFKTQIGPANILFHGQNKTNECSIQVTKAKRGQGRHVKYITEYFIKRLLNDSMNGKRWDYLVSEGGYHQGSR